MNREATYRGLCGALGLLLVVSGLLLYGGFFGYHGPASDPALPTGPVGFYFVGFAGSALVAWGGCLVFAARRPATSRGIATATAVGFLLCALMRLAAWVVGDYYALFGELPRVEAAFFLLTALALVWLRPATPREVPA